MRVYDADEGSRCEVSRIDIEDGGGLGQGNLENLVLTPNYLSQARKSFPSTRREQKHSNNFH